MTINDVTIRNGVVDGDGGASWPWDNPTAGSNLILNRVHITSNTASGLGGGLAAFNLGGVNITESTFSVNSGDNGGGIYEEGLSGSSLLSSTISGNNADSNAGYALIGSGPGSTLSTLYNSTITGNTSMGNVGGLGVEGEVSLLISNTISPGNASEFGPDCSFDMDTSVTSNGYNPIGNSADCNFPAGGTEDQLDVSQELGSLADNGGPTPTHAVAQGTPAYNAGNPTSCNNGGTPGQLSDQRGQDRVADGRCEIGAYEAGISDLKIIKQANTNQIAL